MPPQLLLVGVSLTVECIVNVPGAPILVLLAINKYVPSVASSATPGSLTLVP